MTEEELALKAERMLDAAMGGLTPHEHLIQSSLADQEAEKVAERAAAIAKNRERALRLLAEIEKSQG